MTKLISFSTKEQSRVGHVDTSGPNEDDPRWTGEKLQEEVGEKGDEDWGGRGRNLESGLMGQIARDCRVKGKERARGQMKEMCAPRAKARQGNGKTDGGKFGGYWGGA